MGRRAVNLDQQLEGRLLNRSLDLYEELVDGLPMAVVGLAEDGRILLCNRRMQDLLARSHEDLLGKLWFESVVPAMDTPAVRAHMTQAQPPVSEEGLMELSLLLPGRREATHARLHFRPLRFRDRYLVAIILEDVSAEVRLETERDRLLAALFHDLRAPLSGICTFQRVIAGDAGALVPQAELFEAMQQVGVICRDMIDLIDTTTEQLKGSGDGEAELLDLAFIAHGVALETQLSGQQERIRVLVNGQQVEIGAVDGLLPLRIRTLRADASRCLRNLLGNALKYAVSRIELRVFADLDVAEIWVEDDGPGIPAGYEERIFEGGVQAPGARPGTGLGLQTVRLWAEAMGGTVVAGRSELGGACLRLRLPLA